jgi:hypothetical protein
MDAVVIGPLALSTDDELEWQGVIVALVLDIDQKSLEPKRIYPSISA